MPPTKSQLQKIHIAKKELGLSDDIYRDILHVNFAVTSSKEITPFQADKLLAIFTAKGWKARRGGSGGGTKRSPVYDAAAARKVVAMWITMAKKGVVRNAADHAIQAYVKKVTGIDNLNWCDSRALYQLIESLKAWGQRAGVDFDC